MKKPTGNANVYYGSINSGNFLLGYMRNIQLYDTALTDTQRNWLAQGNTPPILYDVTNWLALETLRYNASFLLQPYSDGKKLRIANTHATNTITCTLPSGQTMNGQTSFTIAPDTILEFELIGTAWKCVSKEWEFVISETTFGVKSINMSQYKEIKIELFSAGAGIENTTTAKIYSNMNLYPSFGYWDSTNNYYGAIQISFDNLTITYLSSFTWLRRTFSRCKIYGMK